jgi:hypothetical protein
MCTRLLILCSLFATTGCTIRLDWPEHELHVTQRAHLDGRDDALHIEIDALVDQLELMPCEPQATLATRLLDALIPAAHAHGEEGPTLLVPHMASPLHLWREAEWIGRMTPPPARWCSLRVLLRAADDEAIGPSADHMRGASILTQISHNTTSTTLSTSASAERLVVFDEPLELGSEVARRGELELIWDLNAVRGVVSEGLDAGVDEHDLSRAALGALIQGARVSWRLDPS